MKQALIVIDVQNDYFPGGKYPLWNAEKILQEIVGLVGSAKKADVPVILVQHVAVSGAAPFFNKGTEGALIHSKLLEAVPGAPIVVKEHADSFYRTELANVLDGLEIEHVMLCGMMTQNCVTHTALSKAAEKYKVSVISGACTTVDEMIHLFAVGALMPRGVLMERAEFHRA